MPVQSKIMLKRRGTVVDRKFFQIGSRPKGPTLFNPKIRLDASQVRDRRHLRSFNPKMAPGMTFAGKTVGYPRVPKYPD